MGSGIIIGIAADHPDLEWVVPVEIFFVSIFTFEMALKLFGYGLRFFEEPFNIFELVITMFSLIEVLIQAFTDDKAEVLSPCALTLCSHPVLS